MPGLQNSRWALRDGRSSSVPAPCRRPHAENPYVEGPHGSSRGTVARLERTPRDAKSAADELARYSKIVRRMKWKLPFLEMAHQQATATSVEYGTLSAEAELMFKLDFFEYYMLCERALVHLQGVFGITISRGTVAGAKNQAVDRSAKTATHRFHANVLEALDTLENPLHEFLGTGNVRRQLARAKDLRNRWKNADDGDTGATGSRLKQTSPAPLVTYDLATILSSIHGGLDCAFIFTRDFVASTASETETTGSASTTNPPAGTSAMDTDPSMREEEEWGFMVEAMDWEAV
ncbi:hypothetical protein Sste5346_003687 [Sporothrix stenoceras]|uniref:Fungal specific transcription factor n=1 Tax=Sporothrix stenoceras TaxID=5173 RepID=A0ABR3ZFF0_9PEZI